MITRQEIEIRLDKYVIAYHEIFRFVESLQDLTEAEKDILTNKIIQVLKAHKEWVEV